MTLEDNTRELVDACNRTATQLRECAARADARERTARQLADVAHRFGQRAADAYADSTPCATCGAIAGYVHAAGCAGDTHPELGQERV